MPRVTAPFLEIIDSLDLNDLQKRYLRDRWLDQVNWFEKKAGYNSHRYIALRIVVILGGVTIPALVSLNARESSFAATLAWVTFSLSLVVAVAAALEVFLGYGERWRSFRRTVEALKSHGWQFFELSGPYALASHTEAFPVFASQVEGLVQQDVEAFIAAAVKAEQSGSGGGKAAD
jgi:hypothetical protein